MKYSLILIVVIVVLSACKKDYACYGSETMRYELYADSTKTNAGIFVKHQFETFESCINCSKKDKDKLLQMMLEYIVRQEEEIKSDYSQDGNPVKEEIFISNELICEEK